MFALGWSKYPFTGNRLGDGVAVTPVVAVTTCVGAEDDVTAEVPSA